MFSKATSLAKLSAAQSALLIEHLLDNISTSDEQMQKAALACLLKASKKQDFDNKTIKLPKYHKLLDGLCDDVKFKDMVVIIEHGQQSTGEEGNEAEGKQKSKESIPRLAPEDRAAVLPVVIKLLLSKLLKKKGALNKKSFHQRLTIVYTFFAGLHPQTEFPLVFAELLAPLGLKLNSDQNIEVELRRVSFSKCIQFIAYSEVIFKQLGTLLQNGNYLQTLSQILVLMLAQAKHFLGSLQEQAAIDQKGIYQFVSKQCQTCVRKGLKIVKQLFTKFNLLPSYMVWFSDQVYQRLAQDQLAYLPTRYASEKAQLVEVLTTHWSKYPCTQKNYLTYPKVLPALMQMLHGKVAP